MDRSTLISGALLAQVLLGIVMFVGAWIMHSSQRRTAMFRGEPMGGGYGWDILILLLASVTILVFTDSMSASWGGLFKNTRFSGISREWALPSVFVLDLIVTTRLVAGTGGSVDSPFQPVFFLIPTLALLLYEPTINIILYSAAAGSCFLILIAIARPLHSSQYPTARIAYGFVSVACLILTVVIGLLTRTCPSGIC